MSETTLPPDLDAALTRLDNALASGSGRNVDDKATAEQAEALAEAMKALQQKLAASEAQVARLRIALAGATSQRSAALEKVDSAVQQVEMLLMPADSNPDQ